MRSGHWRPQAWRCVASWDHHSKRYELGELECLDKSGRTIRLRLVLEAFPDHARGVGTYQALELLWQAGLHPPAQFRVPRPFGWDDHQKTLVRAFVPGQTWADFVLRPEVTSPEVSQWAAGWLITLQQKADLKDSLLLAATGASRVIECGTDLAGLAEGKPHYRAIARLAVTIAEGLEDRGHIAAVPSHGDFHPRNMLIAGPSVVALNVGRLGLREPAADPGRALGQLVTMSLARTNGTAAGATAAMAFWRAYEQFPGSASWDRVALHAAATLLERIRDAACAHRGAWPGTPRQWAAQLEHWLQSDGPRVLADLAVKR